MRKMIFSRQAISFALLIICNFAYAQTWHLVPQNPNFPKTEAVVAGFTADVATYGNGTTDATTYLQNLLNQLDKAGNRKINMWSNMELVGGGVLYLPAGKYLINGKLLIPKGITIRGDWKKPVKGKVIEGTILMTNQGRNSTLESNAFITMQSGAAVMDLAIWYPQQDPNNIVPYAPTILMGHPGGPHGDEFCNVKNVTLVNSYDGVIFSQIGGTCPTINGLYGTPLHQGVEIDRIVDIGRIEHIDFSPVYWAYSGLKGSPTIDNTAFRNQLYDNATGVVMRRNDWSYSLYVKVEGYNKGFHTTRTRDRNDQATPNGHNYGFEFSNCKYGLYFDSSAGEGCMFTEVKTAGCEFGTYFTENAGGVAQLYKWDLSATRCAIFTDPKASVKITMLESTVRAGKVLLQGGTLAAAGNDFNNPQPQIEFEANSRGDITGNRSDKAWQISENSVFQNLINHDPVTLKPLPAYYEFIPRTTKPDGTAFLIATDAPYNAPKGRKDDFPTSGNTTVADATNAIQQALTAAGNAGGGIVYLPPGHYRIDGQLTIPPGVELKGSMDVSAFPLGPGSVLEIYNQTSVAVVMQANSGMRGINFNYPAQVYCTVMPNPIDYPFSIQGRGENIYIVNVAMRVSNRGVDLASYNCDNFYIDYLTGYFFREGVNIKNSKDGVLANMQCNTIVFNNGEEVKFGQYPNSNRPSCGSPADKNPYTYNSRYMTFLTLENVDNILLYGDFNYNALVGMHVKNNVNGLALGFALDDDRSMLFLDGSNINLNFINLQGVALQRENATYSSLSNDNNAANYGYSTYIRSSSNFTGEVNLFNSDYWGYAGASGILMNGSGTINIYGGNFMHAGENSFANVNNGYLNVTGSVVNPANGNRATYNGTAVKNITTVGSITKGDNSVAGNTNISLTPQPATSGALNDCNTWTATASYTYEGAAQNIVNCGTNSGWSSGWQDNRNPQGAASVWIRVDMKTLQTFNQVILEYNQAANDGPETYILEVSNNADGSWTQVASGNGRSTSMLMISFPTQTARYARITKPASNTGNFWRIYKLYVANIANTDLSTIPGISDGTPEIGWDLDGVGGDPPAVEPNYPEGYPQTMVMSNPLFWQFGSETVNANGDLITQRGNLYTADASARVWNIDGVETLFVYASHDMQQGVGCDRMDRYHVFSTTDMVNWTDYGEIFNAGDVPWHTGTFRNNSKFMWAPDCVYKDGKYYYYFPHPSQNSNDNAGSWGNNWQTGIAVSEFPASDFTILPNWLQGLNNGAQHQIDPHVFIDDDGRAYFYNGGGGRCFGGILKDNMIEIDGNMQEMQGLVNFHEATWIHKYNGKYYLSYSDNSGGGANNGDQLKYAVSDHPLGPWIDMGAYIYATGCGTIHGSVVEYKGQWYAFYHTDYISNGGEQGGRSVHVDKLFHNPDGSIQLVNTFGTPYQGLTRMVRETSNPEEIALILQAEDFNDGGATYGYHDRDFTDPVWENNTYRPTLGMQIESRGNGYNLGRLDNKEFTRYTIDVEKAGLYDVDCYVASQNTQGRFQLNINGVNKSGTLSVPNTGSWGDDGFVKVTAINVPLKVGKNLFEFRVTNGGFNLDRFEFHAAQPYAGTPYKTHNVPGKVEAEDFDRGGQGVAYFDTGGRENNYYAYRTDDPATGPVVDLERDGSRINIAWTSGGEWTKYTLNVTQPGIYDVTVRVASGNGSSGSLSLTFDDIYEYPSLSATTANWGTFTDVVLQGVKLTQGKHIMTMTVGGNINIDYYNFVRTGEITGIIPPSVPEITPYPNPTTGIVYFNAKCDVKVYNLQGILLQEKNNCNQIDLSMYVKGLYLLQINGQKKKLIKI